LHEILYNDPNFLDINLFIQILQASSQKQAIINNKEWSMLDLALRRGGSLVRTVDLDKKCLIFKYISMLELSFNPTKFEFPIFFLQIKEEIKFKLYDLTENSLLAIIQSYQILPQSFFVDLFIDVLEIIKLSLETNKEAISSAFLIEILAELNKIKISERRDLIKAKINIETEIINRVKEKDQKLLHPKVEFILYFYLKI
jgi:hypothetical protein